MTAIPKTKQAEAEALLVPAKTIARRLSCSSRYVHMLHEAGAIPGHRFGKACIRFREADVFAALGIRTEAAAGQAK
jgi:excisionase family DNA binding protein